MAALTEGTEDLKTETDRSIRVAKPRGMYAMMAVLLESMLILGQVCSVRSSQESSNRFKVLRLHIDTKEQLSQLRRLQITYNLDPWMEVGRVNSTGDYLVFPQHIQELQRQLHNSGIRYHVLIDDAERFFHDHNPVSSRRRLKRSATAHDFRHKFLSYTELRQFLKHVKNSATNARVEMGSIGRSYEGRPTPYVKISSLQNNSPKGTIFIDGGIHGREWISPALTVEIIHRLAFNSENDTAVNSLLSMFDWMIVPLVNPDGYAHTFTPGFENRMWRKSRSTVYSNDPYCFGVDINRNFGFHWNNSPIHGGSSNPCSSTYSGPRSFSEPESRNMQSHLLKHNATIQAYLSFHSFGQFFLYPWGYSSDAVIDDEDDLLHVASAFSTTMMAKNYDYSVGGSAKVLYPAAGGSDDYVRGTVGVKYAYTVELPPHETSHYGFLLPEPLVRNVVSDTWDGLKAFAFRLYNHLLTKNQAKEPDKNSRTYVSGQSFTSATTEGTASESSRLQKGNMYSSNALHSRQMDSSTGRTILKRIQHVPVSYLIQSLWTRRPLWFSPPRNPGYHLKETSEPDIINRLILKTQP